MLMIRQMWAATWKMTIWKERKITYIERPILFIILHNLDAMQSVGLPL